MEKEVSSEHPEAHAMKRYVDIDEALDVLEKIRKKREECNCSKSSVYEAKALGYAIAVLKKLPVKIEDE